MENQVKDFKVLSSAAVARLSHDMREKYFEELLQNLESDDDGTPEITLGEPEVNDTFPENVLSNDIDSDVELNTFPIEVGHGGDSDIELSSEDEGNGEEIEVNEQQGEGQSEQFYVGKDGTKWSKSPHGMQRMSKQNIFREARLVGPSPGTKNLSEVDTFSLLMHPTIQSIICRNTNSKGEAVYQKLESEKASTSKTSQKYTWNDIDEEELCAFFGILLVMGSHNSSSEDLTMLWKTNANPLYRATMSLKRFSEILLFIRLDQENTRENRMQADKAAPISEIFNMLNTNLRASYRPRENLTIDEQLFPFRGRTKFTQYMPSKPAKYGIKLWWICDSQTYYPLTAQIYTGKTNNVREVNQGERVVKDLIIYYKNSGRNVTCDNFFTSIALANTLASWKISLVGTMKKKTKLACLRSSKPHP